ncbi:MAG: hypothetical protein COT74_09520 [Bdellovibrionales bacterium CG10_big_fil_rev_8_21_14_0_10_45_34]|nr:MAG: hypothetical protein COT74_09520 [Bdellovibrionales bacterium CG10_big_fil_rev_8_21_14_0_10_45_34]
MGRQNFRTIRIFAICRAFDSARSYALYLTKLGKNNKIESSMNQECREHDHEFGQIALKGLRKAVAISLIYFLVEFIGGTISQSLALVSDAYHMLADSAALAIAWLAMEFSNWHRNSRDINLNEAAKKSASDVVKNLATLINTILLFGISLFLFRSAYERWHAPLEVDLSIMLPISVGGLIVNVLILKSLSNVGHTHIVVASAALHVVADSLSSVASIVAGLCIYFWQWHQADAIAGAFIATLIFVSTVLFAKKALGDKAP